AVGAPGAARIRLLGGPGRPAGDHHDGRAGRRVLDELVADGPGDDGEGVDAAGEVVQHHVAADAGAGGDQQGVPRAPGGGLRSAHELLEVPVAVRVDMGAVAVVDELDPA